MSSLARALQFHWLVIIQIPGFSAEIFLEEKKEHINNTVSSFHHRLRETKHFLIRCQNTVYTLALSNNVLLLKGRKKPVKNNM